MILKKNSSVEPKPFVGAIHLGMQPNMTYRGHGRTRLQEAGTWSGVCL
jgi:hypothetical protein